MPVEPEVRTMLRDIARQWVDDRSTLAAFRKLRDAELPLGFDPEVWQEISQMGWPGAGIPEEFGGSGIGFGALGAVLEQAGRNLTASPLLASGFCAAHALVAGGNPDQKRTWLPGIAEGSLIASLAIDEGPHHAPERTAMTATMTPQGYRLDGRKVQVPEGLAADLLIVSARIVDADARGEDIALFLVPSTAPGITRTGLRLISNRGSADIDFAGVALASGAKLGGADLLDHVLDASRIGLAAEMLGAASHAFEITLDYLKTRTQFGQLIGAFQALQHRAAQMYIELELARSAVHAALDALDSGDAAALPVLACLAKAKASEAYHLVSCEMVQMHGGMGMTDECDAGLFLKHARTSEHLYGNVAFQRSRYASIKGY